MWRRFGIAAIGAAAGGAAAEAGTGAGGAIAAGVPGVGATAGIGAIAAGVLGGVSPLALRTAPSGAVFVRALLLRPSRAPNTL